MGRLRFFFTILRKYRAAGVPLRLAIVNAWLLTGPFLPPKANEKD